MSLLALAYQIAAEAGGLLWHPQNTYSQDKIWLVESMLQPADDITFEIGRPFQTPQNTCLHNPARRRVQSFGASASNDIYAL